MSETKVYPSGIRVFPKHEKAPDFVKASIVINIDDLVSFCQDHPEYLSKYNGEDQLKLQLLDGKKGLYCVVDNYKRGEAAPATSPEDDQSLPF